MLYYIARYAIESNILYFIIHHTKFNARVKYLHLSIQKVSHMHVCNERMEFGICTVEHIFPSSFISIFFSFFFNFICSMSWFYCLLFGWTRQSKIANTSYQTFKCLCIASLLISLYNSLVRLLFFYLSSRFFNFLSSTVSIPLPVFIIIFIFYVYGTFVHHISIAINYLRIWIWINALKQIKHQHTDVPRTGSYPNHLNKIINGWCQTTWIMYAQLLWGE